MGNFTRNRFFYLKNLLIDYLLTHTVESITWTYCRYVQVWQRRI